MGGVKSGMENKWEKAKKRYILTDLTIEQVAEEQGLNVNTLRKKASKEKWKDERTKQGKKRTKKALEKAVDRASTKAAVTLNEGMEEELDLAKQIMKYIKRTLQDEQQFNRHIVTHKGEKFRGSVLYTQWIEEQELQKVDTKALNDLAKALETVEGIHRRTSKQLTRLEEERLKLDRERLEIEREKLKIAQLAAGRGLEDGEQQGIVMMPTVDIETYEKEQAELLAQYEKGDTNE